MGILSYLRPTEKSAQSNNSNGQHAESKSAPAEAKAIPALSSPQSLQSLYPPVLNGSTPLFGTPLGTPTGSRPPSQSKNTRDIRCSVMATWLYQQQTERIWNRGEADEGVVIKRTRNEGIEALNVRASMTVHTRVIELFLEQNDRPYVPLTDGLRLQVLPDITHLPRCQKHQFAAFILDRGILVVWDDEPRHLLDRAHKIEKQLMEMIWTGNNDIFSDEKAFDAITEAQVNANEDNIERGEVEQRRPISLLMPLLSAFTLCLTVTALGSGYRLIAIEILVDHSYLRLAFIAAMPAQIWLALFFFQAMVGNCAQIIGPVSQMRENTKFYSGQKPKRLRRDAGPLPHVTIQMPVFKEGLRAVIEPTVISIKAAISTYEMQGGTANIFVNDDGMQVISEGDARARQDFYDEHNIGWTARPKECKKPKEGEELFLRRGKFKKASNMNYGLCLSNRIEQKLMASPRHEGWTQADEASAYREALAKVVEEDEGRTRADGNIRIGDYLLLIDSDTRVPEDCFLDCVSEMEQCPQVAILQYSSGVMNVTDSFFERGITFFTNLVYTQIRYAVATGDVAPFVGHNAVLRWSAMQEIAYDCPDDNKEKYWSESTVSEDFDMALRLQTAGYLVRLGAYTGDGFQEGVSLNVYDELSRWEKYAYGCSELVFHPLRYWPTRGPFTKLFKNFITSKMPFPSKITIMAYVGTYYALASAWIMTFANYFLTGWLNGHLDHYYLDSFKVYFAIIIVFTALGNFSLAVLRYRSGEKGFLRSFAEAMMWVPLLTVFLGGISLHVSQAILSHLFSVDMTWGATSKEAENTTFFAEVPKILKKFKFTFTFCILSAAMMIVLACFVPPLWRIDLFISIWPLGTILFGHFFLPIALNPGLMRFTW
ncbi:hypothetical protein LTR37_011074 [Vermiconidia calcicola]|uniref:Uncharacterized protein n=1 Tax=Vermiconidia calcicola TaxID=1690605 RepID=A0ACC3N494_9PEZI|nr:hypothetical protein LTR37_011074 [Vermiconidia calcicola]